MIEFFIGDANNKIVSFQANVFVCLMIIALYVVIKAIQFKEKKDEHSNN